jgi:hypothetical protein
MRNYARKTEKGKTSKDDMMRAVKEVKENKRSIRITRNKECASSCGTNSIYQYKPSRS